MKKVVTGGFLLMSGIFLYIGVHLSATLHMQSINGWRTPPGRFGTALNETQGAAANSISITLSIMGLLLLIWGCFFDGGIRRKPTPTE